MANPKASPRAGGKQVHRIGVFLCRHHSIASLGLVMDTFRMANQVPGSAHRFALSRISQDGGPVDHPDGTLAVDGGLALLPDMDVVVIPSLWTHGEEAVADSPALVKALKTLPPRVLVATLCTGAYLLAASGRLNKRRATTHWMLADGLQAQYPQVKVEADQNLTHEGPLICSGGSLAAVDACIYTVQLLASRDVAKALARLLVTDVQRGPQSLYAPPSAWRRHGDREVRKLETFITDHHDQPLTLDELAAKVHVSVRTLQRRFVAATGLTPIQYQQTVRVERGKDLLEAGHLPVQDIAAQVGYQDRVAFGRLFKKMTGMTPAAYRQRMTGGVNPTGARAGKAHNRSPLPRRHPMPAPPLDYLFFDYSEDTDGCGVFDAVASTSPGQRAAVQAEVDAVLQWAHAAFPDAQGPIADGFAWDHDLQQTTEQQGDTTWCTTSLTISASPAFREAFLARFPNDDPQ